MVSHGSHGLFISARSCLHSWSCRFRSVSMTFVWRPRSFRKLVTQKNAGDFKLIYWDIMGYIRDILGYNYNNRDLIIKSGG